jgi:hypothetical protein
MGTHAYVLMGITCLMGNALPALLNTNGQGLVAQPKANSKLHIQIQ